ncbi:hypothetical protein F511_07355 [Dorcoceras hygrometricum]|uniref:RING-type domain-containing protein n=1 Tax=Dorcoceras hygrometricum TaxID=472368 RepID=A0A2Z7BAC1_9LAMI|nr:hypothetical protein F511_07355 [Dorcoceras hygrometricum]
MDVDLVTEDMWEGENFTVDDSNEDILNFDGERCGICMDAVIDRGVLDCCQHWFCFACIDNWATITSLCPLCQNEFQLITCVPVYDTVGGYKTDEDTIHRDDDDWFIEGKNNTLSFPSYYIDENAVVCLDEDGCKIRNGSVVIEEDLDVDTSIACDSCDKWYHAFCVGFDPEGTCDNSWLCPRCAVDDVSQMPHEVLISKQSNQPGSGLSSGYCQAKSSFSERVSISLADDGETAIVISLLDGNHRSEESRESVLRCDEDVKNTLSTSYSNFLNSKETLSERNGVDLNLGQQEMEVTLLEDGSYSSSRSVSSSKLKRNTGDADKTAPGHANDSKPDLGLDYDIGSLEVTVMTDLKVNDKTEDPFPGDMELNKNLEEYLLPADKLASNNMELLSVNSTTPAEKETVIKVTGAKRKLVDRRNDGNAREAGADGKFTPKKIRPDSNNQLHYMKDQTAEAALVDISAIVQGTDHRSENQHGHKICSNATSKERESAVRLRLKKIMRRTSDDKDSSSLVQELRKKIREAVRDKSSKEPGKTLFDPKLLEAFRAALAGSGTENTRPTLDMKAKRSLLQKGKVRESLTKKIYGSGGKRRRAWTRECEVEFWKHRCIKTTNPEKIQTLNSVLDQLRDDSGYTDKTYGKEEAPKVSILSRLYLADTSVFPRKDNIQPFSTLKDNATIKQKREVCPAENSSKASPTDHSDKILSKNSSLLVVSVPLDVKGADKSVKGLKAETASGEAHQKRCPKGSSTLASGGMKASSKKDTVNKLDITKGDKRKWALEVLARKTASSNKSAAQEKDEDSAILKGNYLLLAQLPKEMQPVLAPCRHNKISVPVRQAQLYRLAEHFLKKVNPSSIVRTAETELAVADAVNIEKEVADRSNSKLVYVNLCSQELMRRSDNLNSDRNKESNLCSSSEVALPDKAAHETNCIFSDLVVEDALRSAGLMSDSPPNSPTGPVNDIKKESGSEKSDDEGPDNVFEADSHPELDIYGDFEYNLEDDDFIGAGGPKISELQPESKIKMVFSSLNLTKTNGILGIHVPEGIADIGALKGSSDLLESQNKLSGGSSVANGGFEDYHPVKSSLVDGNEEPSLADCEELYGPDKEPLIVKYPDSLSTTPVDQIVNRTLLVDSADAEKDSGLASENHVENSDVANSNSSPMLEESSSCLRKREDVTKKEKKSYDDAKKQSNSGNSVMHKVEAYIKEHIRPLCKSGVITVEQYRWAVQKTTEKVMKYHAKEKNANFLIKEGEKVKKLAEQYVEAAQKAK